MQPNNDSSGMQTVRQGQSVAEIQMLYCHTGIYGTWKSTSIDK